MTMKNFKKNISAEPDHIITDVFQEEAIGNNRASDTENFRTNLAIRVQSESFYDEENKDTQTHDIIIPISEFVRLGFLVEKYYTKNEIQTNYYDKTHILENYFTKTETDDEIDEKLADAFPIDSELDDTSTHPVQNKVITGSFYNKAEIVELLNNINVGHGKLVTFYVDENNGDIVVDDDGFEYYTVDEADELFTVNVQENNSPSDANILKSYLITQGTGTSTRNISRIDIPKDFLVKSVSLNTASDNSIPGIQSGDKYIDFVINTKNDNNNQNGTHLYLNVKDLVDVYSADNVTLQLSASNVFSIKEVPVAKITGVLPANQVEHQDISGKVDKVTGKGLSTNDFTNSYKDKLDNIETQANKYVHPTQTAFTGTPDSNKTPAFGETVSVNKITTNTLGHVTSGNNYTIKIPDTEATTSVKGLMSTTDKSKLDSTNIRGATATGTTSAFTATITNLPIEHGTLITLYNNVGNNTAQATLKINNGSAKPIYNGTSRIEANEFKQGTTFLFMYNDVSVSGGCWQIISDYNKQISSLESSLNDKVDKVQGKQLSTNDFTNTYKAQLDNLETYSADESSITMDANNVFSVKAVDTSKVVSSTPNFPGINPPPTPSGTPLTQQHINAGIDITLSRKESLSNKVRQLSNSIEEYPSCLAVTEALDDKVDTVQGKGLSTNDFTDAYKDKLDSLDEGGNGVTYISLINEDLTLYIGTEDPASIVVTSDKDILQTEEECTIQAVVKDKDDNVLEGVPIDFEFEHNGTVIDTVSVITNSNGICSTTYTGTGAGDIDITAKFGSLVSETYEVEDCEYWNPTGVSYNSTSSTDRKVLSGLEDIEFTPKANYEVSFKLTANTYGKRFYFISKPQSSSSSNYYGFGGDIDTNYASMTLRTTSSSNYNAYPRTNPMRFKFVFNGNTVQYYANDNLVTTQSVSWIQQYAPYVFSWGIWNTGNVTASEIKVKAL